MSVPKLHSIVGYRTSLRNGLHIIDEDTIIYPAGNVYVLHNIKDNTKCFLTDSKLRKATKANFDLETKTLALTVPGKRRDFVALFDLNTTDRLGSLSCDEMLSKTFVCLSFSPDGTHVIGQTGPPDWKMVYWDWIKNEVVCAYEPLNLKKEAEVYQVSFHPKDPNQVCSVGRHLLRTYRISGGNFKQYVYQKHEEEETVYLCHSWLSKTKIAVGTNEGNILVMENNEQVHCTKVTDIYAQDPNRGGMLRRKEVKRILTEANPIGYLTVVNKLLLALWGRQIVVVFEITSEGISEVPLGAIELPQEDVPVIEGSADEILSLVVSPRGRYIAASTMRQQIYSFSLSDVDWECCFRQNFVHLLHPCHWGSIEDMDVCVQKPLLVVSTADFIHIWNYKTQKLVLRRRVHQGLSSVAFHPTGNYILAGCLDKLRYYAVYLDDVKILKEYQVKASNKCAFSIGGHRFAATAGYVINVYSSINFELLTRLRGHFGEVASILWTESENNLVTCGMDGAVYGWNVTNAEREHDMVILENGKTVLALASDESIKKIADEHFRSTTNVYCGTSTRRSGPKLKVKDVKRACGYANIKFVLFTTKCDILMTSCISTYSERRLYLGTVEGNVRVEDIPLGVCLKGEDNIGHLGSVKKMKLSYDGNYLMTAGKDSTLCFWKVKTDMIRKQPIVKGAFIFEDDLQEKIKQIKEQEILIENLKVSRDYQLKEKEIAYDKNMENTFNKHKEEIMHLTSVINELKMKLVEIEGKHQMEMDKKAKEYNTRLQKQREEYEEKLKIEYKRLEKSEATAQKQHNELQKELQFKIKQHQEELESIKTGYENRFALHNHELEEMRTHLKNKEIVWEEYIEKMEEDADEEILGLKTEYESQLRKRKETIVILKTKLSILRTKISSQKSEIEHTQSHIKESEQTIQELQETIQNLKDQIKILHSEVSTRDKSLEIRVKCTSELQTKIGHLEKYNFVLKESMKEIKDKLDPLEKVNVSLKSKIKKLEKDLFDSSAKFNNFKLKMKELEKKLANSEHSRRKEKQKIASLEAMFRRCQQDILHCKDNITDPKLLVESINHLHKMYVEGKEEKLENEDNTKQHFEKEKKRLEGMVISLQNRLAFKEKSHQKMLATARKENATLMREIQRLQSNSQALEDIT